MAANKTESLSFSYCSFAHVDTAETPSQGHFTPRGTSAAHNLIKIEITVRFMCPYIEWTTTPTAQVATQCMKNSQQAEKQ